MMRDLKMQMEEQRAKKAAALQAKKDEEAREEERLQRERDELQRKFAQEADSKKKKFDEIRKFAGTIDTPFNGQFVCQN